MRRSYAQWIEAKYCSRLCQYEHRRIVKYVVTSNGCWQWQGPYNKEGYGTTGINGRTIPAHRWIWRQQRGKIPRGLVLHHRCENRGCVNPDHLELKTRGEHVTLHFKGKPQPKKLYCKYGGHEMTEDNLYYEGNGARRCLKCYIAKEKRSAARRKFVPPRPVNIFDTRQINLAYAV
jgi:hypothetical protein